jgi:TolB-like protein
VICPLFGRRGLGDHARHGFLLEGCSGAGDESTGRDVAGDASQDYFTDGLTDELTTRLAKISALRVISRTSVMHYKGSAKTTPEIARELNVDALLVGSVLRSGDRVRISAQLIQARSDKNVWAESYERDLHDILALQADVARTVAAEIKIQVTPQEGEKVFAAGTVNPEAYDSYLKGNYYWEKFTAASMRKALSYYQQAIDADPNYALAYAGLADTYHELWDTPPKEAIPKSRAASEKALQLDEGLAEAHSSLGWVKWIYYWDWAGAEAEFQRALQLNPILPMLMECMQSISIPWDDLERQRRSGRAPSRLTL